MAAIKRNISATISSRQRLARVSVAEENECAFSICANTIATTESLPEVRREKDMLAHESTSTARSGLLDNNLTFHASFKVTGQ